MASCSKAFEVFGDFFDCLPVAIKLCVYGAVGLFVLFGIFKLFF